MRNCSLKLISTVTFSLLVPHLLYGSEVIKPRIQNYGQYLSFSTAGNHFRLYGHVPGDVKHSMQQHAMDKNKVLKLSIVLSLNHEKELDRQLLSITDPSRPDYQHYLNQEEFVQKYAPTAEQVDITKTYLESLGMHVESIAPNRLIIQASGSVAAIEKIFNTELYYYTDKSGKTFYAPAYELQTDKKLPILSVLGLENRIKPKPFIKQLKMLQPSGLAGPVAGLTPENIKKAYSITSNLNGAGQTLALYELDGYTASDVTAYEDAFNLPHVPLENILVEGATGIPSTGTQGPSEVTMDIELMIALAPGVSKILVYEGAMSTAGLVGTFNKIATDNLAKSFSTSWGIPESSNASSIFQAENVIFKQMVAQGQTLFVASGDLGAYADGKTLSVNDPASQAFVVGVGGTKLLTNADGSYLSETTWATGTGPGAEGGTGGISNFWTIPSWQQPAVSSASKGSITMRNVPDVSLDSDPRTGYAIYYQGAWGVFAGTSAAAPLWSALFALVNQERSNNGQGPLGFPNPTFYGLGKSANYASTFHDIADNSTNLFYPAIRGYDLATGWGTFIGDALIDYLAGGVTPPPVTCVHANPTVGVTPAFQQSTPGGIVFYSINLTNNDNAACSASAFDLTATVPSGFTDSLSHNSLTLSPGSSGTTSFQLISETSSAPGNYPFSVNAMNMSALTYTGTGTGAYVIGQAQDQLSLKLDPVFATYPYNAGQYAKFKFTLMNGQTAVPNNLINLTIKSPQVSWSSYVKTGFNGSAQYYIFLNNAMNSGTYQITATAQYHGNTVTANGSFVIH